MLGLGLTTTPQARRVIQGPAMFLPYGTPHSSVVFRHALTSTPSYTGYSVDIEGDAAGPEHHATNGMRGAAAGGTTASSYWVRKTGADWTSFATNIHLAGQMTFEVSTTFLAQHSSQEAGSTGTSLGANQTPLGWASWSGGNSLYLQKTSGTSGLLRVVLNGTAHIDGEYLGWTGRASNTGKLHSYGKPSTGFTRVSIGWDATNQYFQFDDLTLFYIARSDSGLADDDIPWEHLALGGNPNMFFGYVSTQNPMTGADHWLRNLQISTLAPSVPTQLTTGPMRYVAVLSDSIVNAANWENTASAGWDGNYDARIIKAFESRQLRPQHLYRMSAGGHLLTELGDGTTTYSFTAGDPTTQTANLDGTVSTSAPEVDADVRGLVKALGASTIIINAGSNDSNTAAVTPTLFRAALHDCIEYFCGLNGNSAPGTVPSFIFFTNIIDRGFNWNDAASATGSLNGTTTVASVSVVGAFANGDRIGAYSSGSLYIPEDTTVASGGGTATLVLSRAAVGTGAGVSLFNITNSSATSTARTRAALLRAEIDAIPGWFLATYPTSATKIRVIDTFTATGGTSLYNGKIIQDGVHPGYAAIYLLGQAIGQALISNS